MIVCSCNILSDGDVKNCLQPGPDCPRTPAQVYSCLGCSPNCGRCARTIRAIMSDALKAADSTCSSACAAQCGLPTGQGAVHADHHGGARRTAAARIT